MADEEVQKFNKCLLYILIFLMIITGSMNTIFNKIIQKSEGLDVLFESHHWFITYGMFLGEIISFFIYIFLKCREKKIKEDTVPNSSSEEKEKKPPVPSNLIFAITATFDLFATTINTFGLTYLTSSILSMLRSLEIIYVCLWSRIFLKNPIYKHHFLGIGSLIFGLILVGINALIYDSNQVAKEPIVGIILLLISQMFSSAEYIFQEKFIKYYDVHPFQLVGFEGLWGIIIYTIMLIIFQNISCDNWADFLKKGICSINEKGKYHLEDSEFAFRQMRDKISILIIYIFYVISIFFYNVIGISLTKLDSSIARAVVDTSRSAFIWLFFLAFDPVKNTKENYHTLQLIGLLFIVFGTLFYNEIIVIPYWGLDINIRKNIEKRKKQKFLDDLANEREEDDLYVNEQSKDSNVEKDENEKNQ